MTLDEQVKYWINGAENDLPVMDSMLNNAHFVWSLYIGHLVVEKMLKAFYTRDNKESPPKIHNLLQLAAATKLELTREQEEFLLEVNTFNIEARYPDYKYDFYKKCTKEFTE